MINNILSLGYGKMTETIKSSYDISNVRLLIYNSILTLPVSLILVYIFEYDKLLLFDNYSIYLFFNILLSSLLAIILNTSYFISNEENSSLFTQICGNCKDIFITCISYITLNDFTLTYKTVLGTLLPGFSALLFSYKTILNNIKK